MFPSLFGNLLKIRVFILHLSINSILPKLDELTTIAVYTKAAIIVITESKVDSSISDSEVRIPG